MTRNINLFHVSGNLGQLPEVKQTPNGGELVAKFSIASHRSVQDKQAESGWRDQVDWFPVVLWGGLAERVKRDVEKGNIAKGDLLYVEGRIQFGEYTDRQGQRQRSIELRANDYIIQTHGLNQSKAKGSNQEQPLSSDFEELEGDEEDFS